MSTTPGTRSLKRTTTKRPTAAAKPINEPLLPLWRTVRAEWARTLADEKVVEAYHAARAAFHKVEPKTTLGLFLVLLDTDDGDNFADDYGPAVDAMIAQLEAANVPLRWLGKKGRAA